MSARPMLSRIAVLASAAMLAAAGCGDDGEPGDDVTSPPAESPAPTDTAAPDTTGTDTTAPGEEEEPPPAADHEGGPGRAADCGQVAFEPNTDAGAFGIRATGVSCEVAREVAAAGEDADGVRYEAEGFACSGAPRGGQLPTVEWVCTRDQAEITFSTS